jgi:hypothetical protein
VIWNNLLLPSSSPMTEASGISKQLVIYQIPQCHIARNITIVRISNLKTNIINYSHWLILYSLYSILFYCSYTLILYFLHFISHFREFVSTRMLTCFLLSNFSFILSQQTQVDLPSISKIVMLLCPVSCCSAYSLSTQMPACLFMLPIIPP